VERIEHVAPDRHARFYGGQRFTLNVTRADMVAAGWSPSVRLFEAAACATPVISDNWEGLDNLFQPESEIVLAETSQAVIARLQSGEDASAIGRAARQRVLGAHTAGHRASELESHIEEAAG